MKTERFAFDSSRCVMPTEPSELRGRRRDSGRMIVLDRATATIKHAAFLDIHDYFRPGDLLVLNDSYALSNTLSFLRGDAPAQVIVYGHEPDGTSIVEIRPGQHARAGLILRSADDDQLTCCLVAQHPDQLWKAKFAPAARLITTLERNGTRTDESIPLNPTHWRDDRRAYRSVYARKPGSLEIPSAGLHFSADLLGRIADQGVEFAYITLHVGATETLAVRHIDEDEVEDHKVREEFFEVSSQAAAQINRAIAEGRRIVAVGTTVVRALETLAVRGGRAAIQAQAGWTDLYIYPGFEFGIVGAILTNLHRPRSSHIVLTAAFAGQDLLMRSYDEIIAMGEYEFDMFGDSMLIV